MRTFLCGLALAALLMVAPARAEPFDPNTIQRTINGQVLVELEGTPGEDEAIRRRVARMPGVESAVLATESKLRLSKGRESAHILLREASPAALAELTFIAGRIKAGRLDSEPEAPGLVIGAELARRLRVRVGESLILAGTAQRRFPVAAIFETGWRNLDAGLVYLQAPSRSAPLRLGTPMRAVFVYLREPDRLDDVKDAIRAALPKTLEIRDWRQPWSIALQPSPQPTVR